MLIKEHQCDKCEKMFSSKETLKRHINIQHLGLLPFKCDHCEFKTGVKNKLTIHIKSKHTKEPFQCRHSIYIRTVISFLFVFVCLFRTPSEKDE